LRRMLIAYFSTPANSSLDIGVIKSTLIGKALHLRSLSAPAEQLPHRSWWHGKEPQIASMTLGTS
jgi:hypothetical protein